MHTHVQIEKKLAFNVPYFDFKVSRKFISIYYNHLLLGASKEQHDYNRKCINVIYMEVEMVKGKTLLS